MEKNWNDTIVEIIGTLKTGMDGKIEFTSRQFEKTVKYTAKLKVAPDDRWSRLGRRNTFIFIDGLRQSDVDDLKGLEEDGEVNGETRIVVTGHLVMTPGTPGMNDLYNLKYLRLRPAASGENKVLNLNEALSREEWQKIREERKSGGAVPTVAPTAPVAPF